MSGKAFCVLFDLVMAFLFFLIGFLFYRSDGRAAGLLSGYNTKSPEERRKHDEKALCRDYGKRMMFWAVPFLGGALLDAFFPGYGVLLSWILWAVLFVLLLRERHRRER